MNYETVIGLEIHAELSTNSKTYCGCPAKFTDEVNIHICPGCLAMPGTLPVLNRKVVDYGIKAGLATNCRIAPICKQDRKNYFYPDLPKAYQNSQLDQPLCIGGWLDITVDGEVRRIGLTRIHIEEDAGKLLHYASGGSLVDLNRGSVPLIEIVTEPDMRSAEEARIFLENLKSILEYTEVCDCKMQEGSLRCDVNVSVRPVGQKEYGTRVEMKNINSFRAAFRAIEYEAQRQIDVIEDGGTLRQETRRWDDDNGKTYAMRNKEQAQDYRYFPDPDLAPIVVSDEWIEEIRKTLPELPQAKIVRYMSSFGLPEYDSEKIAASKAMALFFEDAVNLGSSPKTTANWLLGDISKMLNEQGKEPQDIPFEPSHLAKLISLIDGGTLSNSAGKKVIDELFENPRDPEVIVKEKGLVQISDEGALTKIVADVIAANPQSVADYKAGKDKAMGFLVGQAMKVSKGQGNPQILNKLIKDMLDSI